MKRIYVCSRHRGPDGQPSLANIERARKLMRAVFDAGHAPFAPHLLYPQVLSESPEDLKRAFEANYLYLDVCDELWVDAEDELHCSKGMAEEIRYVLASPTMQPIVFMPPEFAAVPRS